MRLPFVSRSTHENALRMYDVRLAEARERTAEWRDRAIESDRLYRGLVDGWLDREEKHVADLQASHAQHHDLAMHPPTGILTGPKLVTPMDSFGEKTREAINAMSAGLGQVSRDAMIHAALRLKAQNPMMDDDALAARVLKGEPHG